MKYRNLIAASILAFASSSVFAGKIVVFDYRQAVLQTDYAKQRLDELKKKPEYAKMVAEYEGLRADLKSLSKEAESQGLTWSDDKKEEQRKKAEYIQVDLKNVSQKLQSEQEDLTNKLLAETQKHVPDILGKMVKAQDIDMIVKAEALYQAAPATDITPAVIAELNKVMK